MSELLRKHKEMSAGLLKRIPEIISEPVVVLKSKTHPSESVVAIGEVTTSKGEMVVPIWINQEGLYVDANEVERLITINFVASAYGRDVKTLLEYAVETDGVLYKSDNNEKVRQLFARNGLQLSAPLKLSNFTDRITSADGKRNKKLSLTEPVEQTKDLIAVHNIGEDEFLKTIKLGGFPMPSLAVVKAVFGHSGYGSISVLFGRDTIDPEINEDNEVYSSDAWTPIYPAVDYKVNEKAADRI